MFKSFLAFLLCFLLIFVPAVQVSRIHAIAIADDVIAFVLAILMALGCTFTLSQTDIVPLMQDLLTEFYEASNFQKTADWLGENWQQGLNTYNSWLGMNPGLFELGREFADWAVANDKLPSGGTQTNPVTKTIVPDRYIPSLSVTINGTTTTHTYYPLLDLNYFIQNNKVVDYPVENRPAYRSHVSELNPLTTVSYSVFASTTSSSLSYLTLTSNEITFSYDFSTLNSHFVASFNPSGSIQYIPTNTNNKLAFDTSKPAIIQMVYYNSKSFPVTFYPALDGYYYLIPYAINNTGFPFVSTTDGATATSYGIPNYAFNDTDRIYIDLQQGNLQSVLQALIDLINQVNQNLVSATVAIQQANAGDLPVDTTPFTQLVSSYENLTNQVFDGLLSITDALGSMYTLLSTSIDSIDNAALEDACINCYNAFVNKLSLLSASGSQVEGNFESAQQLASTLSSIQSNYESSTILYTQALSQAHSAYNTAVQAAESLLEVISLNNTYTNFLEHFGLYVERTTVSKPYLQKFNTAVSDYLSGTKTRTEALDYLHSQYRSGINQAKSVYDLNAITSAYQAALDALAVNEFSLTDAASQVSAEAIAMEDTLVGDFDLTVYESMIDFQNITFFPQSESNLYREYFNKILDEDSPFFYFLFYPMVLGIVGIVLGSGVRFAVKASKKEK